MNEAQRRVAVRFWAKTKVDGGHVLWTARLDADGYGRFGFNRKNWKAHRVAWVLAHGPIPQGLFVLHTCRIRRCVALAHLYLGTERDNWEDMVADGTNPLRSLPRLAGAKLSPDQVTAIRERVVDGEAHGRIAVDYGVSRSTISLIATGATWRVSL